MNVRPSAVFEAVIETGETGLAGTLGVELNDNQGITSIGFTTVGISEIATGVYAISALTAPDTEGQYTLIWRDGAGGQVIGIEDVVVTGSAPDEPPTGDTYASVDELARILKIRAPSVEQTAAMERVLLAAAGEINSEIDLADDVTLAGWQTALAGEVNLERAVEHWQQAESPFGILGIGDTGATYIARDSWDRHALKLAPLKGQWGFGVSTLLELREQIVTVLEGALNGNGGFPVQLVPRRLMSPTPPVIDMWPGNAGEQRDQATAGFGDINGSMLFTVRARVAAADNEAEQELLYSFCDEEDDLCVAVALMDDQTLGGLASSVEVLGPSEPTIYQDVAGQTPLLGVQWRVEILNVSS